MFDAPVDLDAYFARIGYDGPRTPELSTLQALHVLHPAAIPFEAVDVLLERGVDLSPAPVTGRTHMALVVAIEGAPWWVDVGFGGCVLTQPLRLVFDEPQRTAHEPFRLRRVGRDIALDVKLGEDWTPTYIADADAPLWADYEAGNWWTSAHPTSLFRNHLLAARTTPEARFTLLNNRLTIRSVDGAVDQRELDAEDIGRALAETFGLPVEADWRPILEKAAQAGR
jgi:N-hydroxyarylamine O-acetyltransferase